MINRSQQTKQIPINIVGSSTFGRYPKISNEKTYNMFMSDNWMVPYAGYLSVIHNLGVKGRAIFTSTILNRLITVVGNSVYSISITYDPQNITPYLSNPVKVGEIDTFETDVYIAENNAGQIAISDQSFIYIYDPNETPAFQKISTDFIPGYIVFHDTYFIAASLGTNQWRLSEQNDGTSFPKDAQHVGLLETKPDHVVGVVRVPGAGNMILVFGSNVTEPWFDVGYALFPYQRNNSLNIDYGCVSASTIAFMDEYVVWLAKNEKSGPIILICDGGNPEKITTDGIDYLFSQLAHPEDSEAFIYRQDGHMFYHINFYTDNLSLFYDFNTKKFYHACDENMSYFISKEVAFFNNQYYFITRNNGNVYAFDTIYTTFDGEEIPRIRVCKQFRLPSQENFIANDIGFTIETGNTDYLYQESNGEQVPFTPRVDMSISYDGGNSFSSYVPYDLNPIGKRINMLRWWQLGMTNDFTPQFRFWGIGRFVVTDGILNVRQ